MDRNSRQTHIRAGNGVHKAYLEIRKKESSFLKKASFVLNPLHRSILTLEKKAFESKELKVLFVNSNMVIVYALIYLISYGSIDIDNG